MKRLFSLLTSTVHGSNLVSFKLRKKIERLNIRQILGVNLAGLTFFSAIIAPQASNVMSDFQVQQETKVTTVIQNVPSVGSEFQWPMQQFGISQWFSVYHPGMDLPAPFGTPVYPVANGSVVWTNSMPYGYGNHVLVQHDKNISSLYAHMSAIEVKPGQTVTKNTEIGKIGLSGWTTGAHLHFEVYQDGVPINPSEVLPDLSLTNK